MKHINTNKSESKGKEIVVPTETYYGGDYDSDILIAVPSSRQLNRAEQYIHSHAVRARYRPTNWYATVLQARSRYHDPRLVRIDKDEAALVPAAERHGWFTRYYKVRGCAIVVSMACRYYEVYK